MAVDETASVLELLRDVRFRTSSGGGVGVETEISVGSFNLRKRGIMTKVKDQSNLTVGSTSGLPGFFLESRSLRWQFDPFWASISFSLYSQLETTPTLQSYPPFSLRYGKTCHPQSSEQRQDVDHPCCERCIKNMSA